MTVANKLLLTFPEYSRCIMYQIVNLFLETWLMWVASNGKFPGKTEQ